MLLEPADRCPVTMTHGQMESLDEVVAFEALQAEDAPRFFRPGAYSKSSNPDYTCNIPFSFSLRT